VATGIELHTPLRAGNGVPRRSALLVGMTTAKKRSSRRRPPSASAAHRVAVGAAVAFSVVSVALGQAAPAHAAVRVGPIDQVQQLKPWCERQMQVGTILGSASPDNPWNAYSWKCRVAGYYRTAGIDMNAVCRAYYGGGTRAKTNNPGWAWSWECWRG
jgi:hypothetical protein